MFDSQVWSLGVVVYEMLTGELRDSYNLPYEYRDNAPDTDAESHATNKTHEFLWHVSEPGRRFVLEALTHRPGMRKPAGMLLKHDWLRCPGLAAVAARAVVSCTLAVLFWLCRRLMHALGKCIASPSPNEPPLL